MTTAATTPSHRRRSALRGALALSAWTAFPALRAQPRPESTLQVGPGRKLQTLAEAARQARDGDTVEVDAGEYRRDVALWTQDRLSLRAVGGRVRLVADGESMEDKAIWVVRGGAVRVQGFDFEGTRVPARNGAGIRFETGHLTVVDCSFVGNEMGLLTSNDPSAVLTVENSEFAYNKRDDGHDHNLYVGRIAKVSVTGSYFHHATIGHLFKSRAAQSLVFYNRLTDETGGRASYELEFPNGGVALVVGNLIQQGPLTENPIMVSFGAEGLPWPRNALVMVNNTLVDELPGGGIFVHVATGDVTVEAHDNLYAGHAGPLAYAPGDYRGNIQVAPRAFMDAARHDYRLKPGALPARPLADPGSFDGIALRPTRQYVHPRHTEPLTRAPERPGAWQDDGL